MSTSTVWWWLWYVNPSPQWIHKPLFCFSLPHSFSLPLLPNQYNPFHPSFLFYLFSCADLTSPSGTSFWWRNNFIAGKIWLIMHTGMVRLLLVRCLHGGNQDVSWTDQSHLTANNHIRFNMVARQLVPSSQLSLATCFGSLGSSAHVCIGTELRAKGRKWDIAVVNRHFSIYLSVILIRFL